MNRLKEIRKLRNKTQTDIAKVICVEKSAVSKYELGQVNLREDQILALCDYLDVTSDYLLGLSEVEENKSSEDVFFKNILGISKGEYSKLSNDSKEKLKEFINFVNYSEKKKIERI